jgi:hypothetical protein
MPTVGPGTSALVAFTGSYRTHVRSTEEGSLPTDPATLASAVNALFESRIPAMHRLGIRIVELREGTFERS